MKTLEDLVIKAKTYSNELPLVSVDELRSKIEAGTGSSGNQQTFNKKRRKLIMISISAAIVSIIGSLIMTHHGSDVSAPAGYDSPKTVIVSQDSENSVDRNSSSDNTAPTDRMGSSNPGDQANTGKEKQSSKYSAFFNRYSKETIEKLNILDLTGEELNAIVPGFEYGDSSFTFVEERYVSNPRYFKLTRMDSLGYDISRLPCILVETMSYNGLENTTYGEPLYNGRKLSEYDRTLYVGYSFVTDEDKIGITDINDFSPLFYFSDDPYLKEFGKFIKDKYDFIMSLPLEKDGHTYKLSDENGKPYKPAMDSLWALSRRYKNDVINRLIPVKVSLKSLNEYILLWFVPNEEFVSRLPLRYRKQVQNEVEIMRKLEKEIISFNEACTGLSEQESLFGICRSRSGAIESVTVTGDSKSEGPVLKLKLTESRNLLITVHTIDGVMTGKIAETNYPAGESVISLGNDSSRGSLLLISVRSGKGEHVVVKYLNSNGQ